MVAVSEGAKMAAPGGATVPLHDGSEWACRLLPGVSRTAAIASPEVLFTHVPTGHGTRPAARATLAARSPAAVEQVSHLHGR
jgi:hypothetical protein